MLAGVFIEQKSRAIAFSKKPLNSADGGSTNALDQAAHFKCADGRENPVDRQPALFDDTIHASQIG